MMAKSMARTLAFFTCGEGQVLVYSCQSSYIITQLGWRGAGSYILQECVHPVLEAPFLKLQSSQPLKPLH